MISGSLDRTVQQWDLKAGKEIEEARGVSEEGALVEVSRNGRWVATAIAGWPDNEEVCHGAELKTCEVETGIVKTFKGHSRSVSCIDMSEDNTRMASGSLDRTARIWNIDTGELVAGPFKSKDHVGAVRFSPDSKKLAVLSWTSKSLEVWDVQSQKLDVKVGEHDRLGDTHPPVFWTKNNKNIIAVFRFTEVNDNTTIYEFDGSTLKTVGTPFEGHTDRVTGLALSFDDALIASASLDKTIKLWAFESRQLLASFDVQHVFLLVLSPDSRQLAYTTLTGTRVGHTICICDTPPEILAQARVRILPKPLCVLFVY
jgi:WD40 repeat protein